MKKNNGQIIFFSCLSIVFLAMAILIANAYTRKPLEFTFDAAYNQCVKSYDGNPWRYEGQLVIFRHASLRRLALSHIQPAAARLA